jgi:hypothetical protein
MRPAPRVVAARAAMVFVGAVALAASASSERRPWCFGAATSVTSTARETMPQSKPRCSPLGDCLRRRGRCGGEVVPIAAATTEACPAAGRRQRPGRRTTRAGHHRATCLPRHERCPSADALRHQNSDPSKSAAEIVERLAVQQQGRRRAGASILEDFTAATLTAATACSAVACREGPLPERVES